MTVSEICAYIVGWSMIATPVLALIFLIRWIMRKPKKKVGIAILVCIGNIVVFTLIGAGVLLDVLDLLWHISPVVGFAIFLTWLIVLGIKELKNRRIENIVSAKVIHRKIVTTGKHRYSGTSFGWYGGLRSYWRYERVPCYVRVWVEAVYKDGKTRYLCLRERSWKCYQVMLICEQSKEA